MNTSAQRPLLVFADDWGRHPSSCQHLVRHLLPQRQIVWVNTVGTRPPRLDWSTTKRVMGKLQEWFSGSASGGREQADSDSGELKIRGLTPPARQQPLVFAPKMWPSFRSRFARRLNRTLLLRALRPVVEALPQSPIVVTTLPLVADLIGRLPAWRWVYYCVDDFSVWPGYDGETMLRMERELVPKVDEVIAVSETLQQHVAALGKPSHLLTHGVDLDHWRGAAALLRSVADRNALTPPFVVFWGVIDRRMDVDFVRHLSANLSAGTILLVGPREDPEPQLLKLPRVVALPAMPYAQLPALAVAASVLVMPYADLPATRAMQPLKLKEYIATGKPTVVRDLPATRPWADCVDVAKTPEQFTALVNERLQSGLPEAQRAARARLSAEGWAEKSRQFAKWLDGEESCSTVG